MEGRGEGKGERMWRGPESGLPRGLCRLSAGLGGRGRKEGGKWRAIKTPLLNGLATGLSPNYWNNESELSLLSLETFLSWQHASSGH